MASSKADVIDSCSPPSDMDVSTEKSTHDAVIENSGEVFQRDEYRALGWIRAAVIVMKMCFATGVLAIPFALGTVGYAPGVVLLLVWGALTTYYAYVMYLFKMKYPAIHNIADAAYLMAGAAAREITTALFLLLWILAAGSGYIALSNGLSVLSGGRVCSVVWTLIAAVCTAVFGSIQTLGRLAILTWIGFASVFTAVFIVVVGVTQVDRPAAAPQQGAFDIEVVTARAAGFVPGVVAAINLFTGYGATPTFMSVMAEMRTPKAFKKSLFSSQLLLTACYVTSALVIYLYCGQYVSSPSIGSAGGKLEKIAYGIGIPGFIISTTLWVHMAAKFLFVRILRDSEHLESHTFKHWAVWLSSTIGISAVAFILATAVPFFSYILGLIGSLCCAPTCLVVPAFMGLYMEWKSRSESKVIMARCALHIFTIVLGCFMTVTGTYTTFQSIVDAYNMGTVGKPFTCS